MRSVGAGTWGVGILLAAAVALTGCAAPDSKGGFGLGTLQPSSADAAFASAGATPAELHGALAVESNGCFTWRSDDDTDGAWLVWPDGALDDADGVVLPDGRRVADGAALHGTGAVVALADLPDGSAADSYFGSFGGFCDADRRGVLVLADVSAE